MWTDWTIHFDFVSFFSFGILISKFTIKLAFDNADEAFFKLAVSCVIFDEIACNFSGYTVDVGHFIPESYTIELVRVFEQFWSESGRDELCVFTELVDHIGHCFTMLCIQSLSK